MNESHREPTLNLNLARAYLVAHDPQMARRTWQEVMNEMATHGIPTTQERCARGFRSKAYDPIRSKPLAQTTAADLLGIVRGNGNCVGHYLRRLHNLAIDLGWLAWPVLAKRAWPKIQTQQKESDHGRGTALLDFVVRLRNFAPFNAMLLQLQKPGLNYAASKRDWHERFGRTPKEDARPLIILWPFGPIALVYDVIDTEGAELPEDVLTFFTHGSIDDEKVLSFIPLMRKKNIEWLYLDAGDTKAGSVRVMYRAQKADEVSLYRMQVNNNHSTATQFVTLAHELAHLFLGHLGRDRKLNIPERPPLSLMEREIEAESVAFLVSMRNKIQPKSQTYLSGYIDQTITIKHLDIYQIMRAAGQVEALLGLSAHTKFEKPESPAIYLVNRKPQDLSFPISYFETLFRTEAQVIDWPQRFAIITAYATTGEQWPSDVNKAADQRLTEELQLLGCWRRRVIGFSRLPDIRSPGGLLNCLFRTLVISATGTFRTPFITSMAIFCSRRIARLASGSSFKLALPSETGCRNRKSPPISEFE